DTRSVVVTRLRNLAFVTDIDPTTLEDAREFAFEDCGVDVDRAMDGGGPDAGAEVGRALDGFHDLWYTRHTKNSKYFGWTGRPVPACIGGRFAGGGGHGGSKEIEFLAGAGLPAAPQRS